MSKVLTSIGVEFYIGYSTAYSALPKGNQLRKIPQVFEQTETDFTPDTIETTSLSNFENRTYALSFTDTSGVQSLTANATKNCDAEVIWNNMVKRFEQGYYIWLCISIPDNSQSTYIPICPIPTRAYNTKLNDRISIKLKYVIVGDLVFGTLNKPSWNNSAWHHIQFINEGNKLSSRDEIDVDDINMLFENVFYLKGR